MATKLGRDVETKPVIVSEWTESNDRVNRVDEKRESRVLISGLSYVRE